MRVRQHLPFAISAALCLVAFAWLISDGSFALLYPESYGDFYDWQAKSLLAGHWDVPIQAISGEAFIVHGKNYGYFGVTPALLRMPFALSHVAFGQLSRAYMLGYFAAALLAGYAILRHLTKVLRGPEARPSATSVVLLTFNLGLGSTLFFLGARAFLYHEAILSGAAFTLWSAYFSLRYLTTPSWRWAGWAIGLGLGAVHCRPTAGLFALGFIAAAALITGFNNRADTSRLWRLHAPVLFLSAAAFFTFNVVSYIKFGTFEGMPQRYAMQFVINPDRLKTIEGKNLHLSNLRVNAAAYLYSYNIVKMEKFPYLHHMWVSASYFPEAKMDTCEEVLALPYSMPALTILAAAGFLAGAAMAPFRRLLFALAMAFVPMAVVLFTAVANSHRYTGDFVPFLTVAAAFGLVALDGRRLTKWLFSALIPFTAAAAVITFAIAMYFQGVRPGTSTTDGVKNCENVAHWVERLRAAF